MKSYEWENQSMAIAAILYKDINYGVPSLPIEEGFNQYELPPPWGQQIASSMKVFSGQWITFWESTGYGDDQLWIAPPPSGGWGFPNLHAYPRPHGHAGQDHWGDRIAAVSFTGPPTGSNSDRTIVWSDGSVTIGRILRRTPEGIWTIQEEEFRREFPDEPLLEHLSSDDEEKRLGQSSK